jgi:hypothetical protein
VLEQRGRRAGGICSTDCFGASSREAQAGAKLPTLPRLFAADLHPLDPLCGEEILAVSAACREYATQLGIEKLRFNSVAVQVCCRQSKQSKQIATQCPISHVCCCLYLLPSVRCLPISLYTSPLPTGA